MTGRLAAADIDTYAAFGITAECLERAQLRRVDSREARDLLAMNGKAGDFAGIEIPYLDPHTGRRVTSRVRLDHPPLKPDGRPEKKYVQAYGDLRHLYFVPGSAPLLADTDVAVLVVESEKAALAITAAAHRAGRQLLVIATGGCWNFRGVIGKDTDAKGGRVDVKGPLPDFHKVAWTGRTAIILFDTRPNESVRRARQELARVLRQWGAEVRHAHLPNDNVAVNGPDDHLKVCGDAALWHVVDRAEPDDFERDGKAHIVPNSLSNIRLALSKLGTTLTYDAFAREVVVAGAAADDVFLDQLWVQIDDTFHFRPSKDTLRTLIGTEAHQSTVHPVRAYLDGLAWDGTHRLDAWLVHYGGAVPSTYVAAAGALPLMAAVRRVRQPGAKFDELLILESPQGALKSSALRALCANDDWFSDDLPLGVDSKLVIERTAGKWIIEAAELHGNRGREAEQLKSFLSRQVDGPVRLAYGRLPTTIPRQFVIIGTTNARLAYLKDATGARRFWPVTVSTFDVAALTRDRDQLWAEAAAREADGDSIRLAPELWAAAGEQQEDRRAVDPWEAILEPLLEGDGSVKVEQISVDAIWRALEMEASQLDNRHADRVAAIVQRFGFTKKTRRRIDGKPTRCWARESESDAI